MLQQLVLIAHVLVAIGLIGLVLIQQGKGADVGAAFGAGASNTVFGSRGATSFLMKVTGSFALAFFTTSLLLGHFAATHAKLSPVDSLPSITIQKQQPSKQQKNEKPKTVQPSEEKPSAP